MLNNQRVIFFAEGFFPQALVTVNNQMCGFHQFPLKVNYE
jgi:hypothetical protein